MWAPDRSKDISWFGQAAGLRTPVLHRCSTRFIESDAMNIRCMLVLVAAAAAGCGVDAPGSIAHEPVPLLAGLRSYDTPETSRARLSPPDWALRQIGVNKDVDRRPKYEKQSAEFTWHECGQTGAMILTFVNDRLYITTFVPSDHGFRQRRPGSSRIYRRA
jgi:hypothetical protein